METVKSQGLSAELPEFEGANALSAASVCPHCHASIPCGSPHNAKTDAETLKPAANSRRLISSTSAARQAKIAILAGLALWAILSHVTITVDKFLAW